MNPPLQTITVFLFIILHVYWRFKHKGAKKVFDFGKQPLKNIFHKSVFSYVQVFVLLQLVGLNIFPIPPLHSSIESFAFLLVLSGLIICITARQTLGKSWTNTKDHKKTSNHQLVTRGLYKYLRHPIYLGLNFMITGAEILAQSYLILLLPLLYMWTYKQAEKEEKHLSSQIGNKYKTYKADTGMFFPKLFK